MAGKNGGARPGAGRPKGSITRPQLRAYFTPAEIKQLAADLKKRAETDPTILKFLAEQVFGKAPHSFEIPDDSDLGFVVGFNFIRNENPTAGHPANT